MWENQKLIEMNTQIEVGELIAFFFPFCNNKCAILKVYINFLEEDSVGSEFHR